MALRPISDVSPARWFTASDVPAPQLVSFGPPGFDAYTRLLHRTRPPHDDDEASQVEGDLAADVLASLCEVLARHTSTPDDCFFGLWDGFGDIHGGDAMGILTRRTRVVDRLRRRSTPRIPPAFEQSFLDGPKVSTPIRDYYLFAGPLSRAGDWGAAEIGPGMPRTHMNSPNLMWPSDHAWFVATEIDEPWTGIGGSAALADELLTDDRFEVGRADPSLEQPYYR